MKHHPSWTALRSYAITAGLACLMGVSYELFVFPNAFAPAGINGLATMLQYLLHINIGYLSLLINLPLVLLAWKKVDRDFARKTLVFVLVFSAVTLVLGQMDLSAIAYDSGSSAILGPVAAGVVSGAVYGWVIRQNGSTGGTDIVAAWVRKKHPEASLVWLIFSLNAAVAVLSFFVYGCQFEPVILCLIYCYLSSSISDTILKGGKSAMKFEVVTRQPEELSRQLMQQLRHGVTVLQAEGMYSETPRSLLICVVNRHQVVRFQEILARFPDTFACVSSVNETWGNSHRKAREEHAANRRRPCSLRRFFGTFTPPPAPAGFFSGRNFFCHWHYTIVLRDSQHKYVITGSNRKIPFLDRYPKSFNYVTVYPFTHSANG
ncbi:MAG: YitT family protein [Dysosmobacter sp.]